MVTFDAGFYADASADTPDLLEIALDKAEYAAGDTMTVAVTARTAGKVTLNVVGDKLFTHHDDRRAGRHGAHSAHRRRVIGAPAPMSSSPIFPAHGCRSIKPMPPTRSIGLALVLGIDRTERTLQGLFAFAGCADEAAPGLLTIPIKIEGLGAGAEKAYVTVAAVDVGILNLTGYKPPEPEKYYYDQKRLSTELHDLYGQLIDGMQGARGKIRTGGDGGALPTWVASPPTQAPMAQFSGIVAVGPDGKAEVTFDIPAFNGSVRVMAVAGTPTEVGHASDGRDRQGSGGDCRDAAALPVVGRSVALSVSISSMPRRLPRAITRSPSTFDGPIHRWRRLRSTRR